MEKKHGRWRAAVVRAAIEVSKKPAPGIELKRARRVLQHEAADVTNRRYAVAPEHLRRP